MVKIVFFICFLFLPFLVSCGGPKTVRIEVSGIIKSPKELQKEDFERLKPVLEKVKAEREVKFLKEGKVVFDERGEVSTKGGIFNFKVERNFEDVDLDLKITAQSSRFLVFSDTLVEGNLEKLIDEKKCKKGDKDEVGYDYLCSFQKEIDAKISGDIVKYLDVRDKLLKAGKLDFCQAYSSSRMEVENLEADIKLIALQDLGDILRNFEDGMWQDFRTLREEVDKRNCIGTMSKLQEIRGMFCLSPEFLARVQTAILDCEAFQLVSEGERLKNAGRNFDALQKFQEALGKKNFAEPYILIADIYFDMRRYGDAETNLKEALRIEKDNTSALQKLGMLYITTKKYDEAEKTLGQVVSILKANTPPDIYYWRAFSLFNLKRFEEAEVEAERVVSILEDEFKKTQSDKVKKDLSQKRVLLAEIYLNLQRVEDALTQLEKSIDEWRENGRAYIILSDIYYSQGDMKKAEDNILKVLRFAPDSPEAKSPQTYIKLVDIYEKKGDKENLEKYLLELQKLSSQDAEVNFKLGKLYAQKPGFEKAAEEYFKRALKIEDKEEYRKEYIELVLKQGRYDVAKILVDDMLKKYPESAYAKRLNQELKFYLLRINPSTLKAIKIPQPIVDEIYSLFSSFPRDYVEQVLGVVGISNETFEKLDPYKKFAVFVVYLDNIYGTSKGAQIQKTEKYKELFPNITKRALNTLPKITSDMIGLK